MGTGKQSEHDGKDESQLISLSDFFNGMNYETCPFRLQKICAFCYVSKTKLPFICYIFYRKRSGCS